MATERYVVERHTIDAAYGFRVKDTLHPERVYGYGMRRDDAERLATLKNHPANFGAEDHDGTHSE